MYIWVYNVHAFEMELRHRKQTGANAYREAGGVMMDRTISRKVKEKVLDSSVVPSSRPTYSMETVTLPELQQYKLHVCENNWISRVAHVNRV